VINIDSLLQEVRFFWFFKALLNKCCFFKNLKIAFLVYQNATEKSLNELKNKYSIKSKKQKKKNKLWSHLIFQTLADSFYNEVSNRKKTKQPKTLISSYSDLTIDADSEDSLTNQSTITIPSSYNLTDNSYDSAFISNTTTPSQPSDTILNISVDKKDSQLGVIDNETNVNSTIASQDSGNLEYDTEPDDNFKPPAKNQTPKSRSIKSSQDETFDSYSLKPSSYNSSGSKIRPASSSINDSHDNNNNVIPNEIPKIRPVQPNKPDVSLNDKKIDPKSNHDTTKFGSSKDSCSDAKSGSSFELDSITSDVTFLDSKDVRIINDVIFKKVEVVKASFNLSIQTSN
jgi:hypothetical protein